LVSRLRRQAAVPRAVYTEWWWPPSPTVYRTVPSGYSSFENLIVPEVDPGPGGSFLWAHGFRFVGGGSGHVGLQTDGIDRRAVFIIEGGHALSGNGMGNGFSVPFTWTAGHEYALMIHTNGESSWTALVQDQATGYSATIGTILVPLDWRRLSSWSVMSTEYLGEPLPSCAGVPRSSVLFGTPTANDGRVEPERSNSRLGAGTCHMSWAEDTPFGVRHLMGGA
jgi:hypothetical protein